MYMSNYFFKGKTYNRVFILLLWLKDLNIFFHRDLSVTVEPKTVR